MAKTWLIGVDEVGRGPLAGPVVVGAVAVPIGFDWSLLPGVADSKTLSALKREMISKRVEEVSLSEELYCAVSFVSARVIDKSGISQAIKVAIKRSLGRIMSETKCGAETMMIKLDGGLYAPQEFKDQETIKGGDGSEKVIGLASVVAKVRRDRYMVNVAKSFPAYNFATHKGYGTPDHCRAIRLYGLSSLHRATFCRKLL